MRYVGYVLVGVAVTVIVPEGGAWWRVGFGSGVLSLAVHFIVEAANRKGDGA